MGIFSKIIGLFSGGIVKEIADAIDKNVTSDEERGKIQIELDKIALKTAEYEKQLQSEKLQLEEKNMVLQSEAHKAALDLQKVEVNSKSKFVQNYKAVLVCLMFILIVSSYMGWTQHQVPESFIWIYGSAFGVMGVRRLFPNGEKV